MVSPVSLYVLALVLAVLAVVVARVRRIGCREALRDGGAALIGTLILLASSLGLLTAAQPLDASALWRDAGSLALLASPLGATLALRYRGPRSIPRALLGSTIALSAVVLWLTLNLRGPRGGWSLIDIALVLPAAASAMASAACLGWWSKRRSAVSTAISSGG